jgi:hypothetical protein
MLMESLIIPSTKDPQCYCFRNADNNNNDIANIYARKHAPFNHLIFFAEITQRGQATCSRSHS